MAIQKREYELSIWNEELIDGIKTESKGIIIGAHDMSYLGRATAIKLTRYVKGTNSLTFQMPTKYFDSEKGEFIKNELIEDLYNERKLKLYYKDKWYEFYIKQISEQKQFKAILKTFTCQDSFIDELSRTGYELEFAPELNNSVEELGEFTEEIIEDSIWDYTPEYNWGDFTEFKEERFYKIPIGQFSSLNAYKLNLKLLNSTEIKDATEIPQIENFNTHERRDIEYGDDLARKYQIFWDNHEDDNGRTLMGESSSITGDYIYVPMSELSYIYGSVYNSTAEVDSPAYYGKYQSHSDKFALQPTSTNPKDLIQFIYFKDNDDVLIDEGGTIVNENCTYVMTIEDWNKALAPKFANADSYIYWRGRATDEEKKSKKYTIVTDGDTWYTTGVKCKSSIVDNFTWYPIYADGYLDKINDQEVAFARKIVVSDRTELNLNNNIYTTVYKNKANEYDYDNEELQNLVDGGEDFRVVSKDSTYEVLPTLARNLVQNGVNITDSTGWEVRTQNINEETIVGTGSFKKLMEINVRAVNADGMEIDRDLLKGLNTEEQIANYHLEFLSPYVEKTDDFNRMGDVDADYAINFGFVGQEKKIEKGKLYAIRMKTIKYEETGENQYKRVERLNQDLDKVIIGEGSTNSKGNYIIAGIDNEDEDKYISFKGLYSANYLNDKDFPMPPFRPEEALFNKTLYRYKNNQGKWTWSSNSDITNSIKDECFVIFRADKTIENPYIAIKVESEPLEIQANGLESYNYTLNNGTGAKVCIIMPKENWVPITTSITDNYDFVSLEDNEMVVFCEINPTNFTQDFLDRCGYNKEDGTINITSNTIELKDGEFILTGLFSDANSYVSLPLYCTTIGGKDGDDKSRANAIFLKRNITKNDKITTKYQFYGVFWFEKIKGGKN